MVETIKSSNYFLSDITIFNRTKPVKYVYLFYLIFYLNWALGFMSTILISSQMNPVKTFFPVNKL